MPKHPDDHRDAVTSDSL
jgi:RNA polymerase primary sigma factor